MGDALGNTSYFCQELEPSKFGASKKTQLLLNIGLALKMQNPVFSEMYAFI